MHEPDNTGRFARASLGPSKVTIVAGDGVTTEFTFEGTCVVAGVERCPRDGALPSADDLVKVAQHAAGTAGGIVLCIALLMQVLEESHSMPPGVVLAQVMLDYVSLKHALTDSHAHKIVVSCDTTSGTRVPHEPSAKALLNALRLRQGGAAEA